MKLELALKVAEQHLDKNHPATIRSLEVCPNLVMAQSQNGQFITTQDTTNKNIKNHWTFEDFVKAFAK